MGNKIGGRRKAGVEERYTRPQGLYEHRDIDQKKLRKLILEAKLAPCYPGADEASEELEECPICFLYYPSLNRSKCCSKGICTECFLQMKPTHTARPTQCPFCKTPNYAVEYRGVKTMEERSIELFEEQKVIEAQLRMRQQALKDEEAQAAKAAKAAKLKRKQSRCSSSRTVTPTTEVEYRDICSTSLSVPSYQFTEQGTECCSSEPSCSTQASMRPFHSRHNRDDNGDINLEEMMVMEAIWRSIQHEQGNLGNPICGNYFPVMEAPSRERQAFLPVSAAPVPAAPLGMPHPGGYSCAVAALAEHQPPSMDFSYMAGSSTYPVYDMNRRTCSMSSMSGGSMCAMENNSLDGWSGIAPSCSREVLREEGECSTDHWSEGAEAGTSYAGSDIVADPATMQPLPFPENFGMAPNHFRPESIEEQMMFSMAVSLADGHHHGHGRTHVQGMTWL